VVDGVIREPRSWLVKPDRPITGIARNIHGITNEDVADAPAFADVRHDVVQALDAPVLVAHNAHVDVDVLRRTLGHWEPAQVLDTLALARRLLPGRPAYRLGILAHDLGLAHAVRGAVSPHRATYDAVVTARLFVHLAGQRTLEELRDQQRGGCSHGDAPTLF
jgi:DNA polymerase III epsilon subunit-like protein